MAATVFAGIVAAFVLAFVLAFMYPDTAARWYGYYRAVRGAVWATLFALIGLVLLGSGSPLLMVSGFFIWFAIAAGLVFEGPLGEVV